MKNAFLKAAFALGLFAPLRFLRKRQAVVLMYHGFTDRPSDGLVNYQGNRLQQLMFHRQLDFLKNNASLVTMRRVVESLSGGKPLPDYPVALTIDDGYESVRSLGFPVLKAAGVHATLFVATQFVDERVPLWPDRLEYAFAGAPGDKAALRARLRSTQDLAKKLLPAERDGLIASVEKELGRKLVLDASAPENYRALTWGQCREMAESGVMEIGSHGHTHTIMTIPGLDAAAELATAKSLIEKNAGRPADLFCYPNGGEGDFSAATGAALKTAGHSCGITTVAGFVVPGSDPYEIRRFGTDDRDSFESFRMTFALGRDVLRPVKRLLRRA